MKSLKYNNLLNNMNLFLYFFLKLKRYLSNIFNLIFKMSIKKSDITIDELINYVNEPYEYLCHYFNLPKFSEIKDDFLKNLYLWRGYDVERDRKTAGEYFASQREHDKRCLFYYCLYLEENDDKKWIEIASSNLDNPYMAYLSYNSLMHHTTDDKKYDLYRELEPLFEKILYGNLFDAYLCLFHIYSHFEKTDKIKELIETVKKNFKCPSYHQDIILISEMVTEEDKIIQKEEIKKGSHLLLLDFDINGISGDCTQIILDNINVFMHHCHPIVALLGMLRLHNITFPILKYGTNQYYTEEEIDEVIKFAQKLNPKIFELLSQNFRSSFIIDVDINKNS
jgi:hypothetical protein